MNLFGYYLQLAARSMRRTPVLTLLMVCAIGLGIGASMTSLTIFHLMSGNPIAHKNALLRPVQLDNWDPSQPWDDKEPTEPPNIVTYRDAMALLEARQARRQVAMFTNYFPLQPENREVKPYLVNARLTTADFFAMFEAPMRYGAGWTAAQDAAAARLVVLSKTSNDKVFGGANSIGKRLRIGDDEFTVTGVLDDWQPVPKVFDVTAGAFNEMEDVYLPFKYGIDKELGSSQNNSCWKASGDGYQGRLESDCVWMNFWVELESPADAPRYLDFLNGYVAEQKKLGRFPRPLNNRLRTVDEWLEAQGVVRDDTRIQVALSFAFLAVCLINTVGLLLAKFLGRTGEVALRRALGATRRTLLAQCLTEAGVIGFCGGLLGLALTWLGLYGTRKLDPGIETVAHLDPAMIVLTLLLAIAATLLAGLLPTWRIARLPPAGFLKTQ